MLMEMSHSPARGLSGQKLDQPSVPPRWLPCCSSCAPAVHVLHHFKSLTLWLIPLTSVLFVAKWCCNVNLQEPDLKTTKTSSVLYWKVLIFRGHWMLTYFTYSSNSEQNRQSTKTHTLVSKFLWVFLLLLIIILYLTLYKPAKFSLPFPVSWATEANWFDFTLVCGFCSLYFCCCCCYDNLNWICVTLFGSKSFKFNRFKCHWILTLSSQVLKFHFAFFK